ncbi:MAG TPA: phosphatase PAP2 family protein [Candidatus Cybelea sp.]
MRYDLGYAVRAMIVTIVAAALFDVLGVQVVRFGEPAWLTAWERSWVDHSTLIAWWLTWSCYVQVMVPIAAILLIVAWLAPEWRVRIIFSVAMLLLCWRGADFFQHIFARPRRLDWVVKHETAGSYPSSHAAIATGFYGLWALMLYISELPSATRKTAAALLAFLAIAICWARLALGAHYLTDLIGGALLAVALVSAGLSVVPHAISAGQAAGRLYRSAE